MIPLPPRSTLFPYTTLFRSQLQKLKSLYPQVNWIPVSFTHRAFMFTGYLKERIIKRERSEEHTSELQSLRHLVCRLLLEKKKKEARTRPPLLKSQPLSSDTA